MPLTYGQHPDPVGVSSAREAVSSRSRAELSPTKRSRAADSQCGFTLVELIMVIVLAGIVAVMVSTVMSRPLQGFVDQSRRAELTDLAASALNRMVRDIRLAVPNTVHLSDFQQSLASCEIDCDTLELLTIYEAGRYRANQTEAEGVRHDPPRCPGSGNCSIPVLTPGMDADKVNEARWMVIYNTGQLVRNPGGPSVITPDDVDFDLGTCLFGDDDQCLILTGAEGFSFQYASPQHRFYLVKDVLGYRCENPGKTSNGNGTGTVRRAVSGMLSGVHTYSDAPLVVDSVSACSFTYEPGTNTRGGVVTLRLTLTKDNETISLLQQVHVDNAP